jgi:hypothetical protein
LAGRGEQEQAVDALDRDLVGSLAPEHVEQGAIERIGGNAIHNLVVVGDEGHRPCTELTITK